MTVQPSPDISSTPEHRFRGRLGRNLLFVLLPISLVPVILMAFTAYTQARDLLLNQISNQLITFQSEEVANLNSWVKIKQLRLDITTRRIDFNESINPVIDMRRSHPDFNVLHDIVLQELETVNRIDVVFNKFMVVDPDGNIIIASDPEWEGMSLAEENFFHQTNIQLSDKYSAALYAPSPLYTDEFIILTSHTINDSQGEPLAFVIGITEQFAIQRTMLPDSGFLPSSYTYFVTNDGVFIGFEKTTKSFILLEPGSEYRQQIRSALIKNQVGTTTIEITEGQTVISVYHWLDSLGIGMVVEVPQDIITSQISTLAPFTFVLVLITILVLGFLIAFSTRRFVAPLLQVVEVSRHFAEGDWMKRAPVERNDEIGLLAYSFNQMADELSTLYRSLQHQVDERTRQIITAAEVAQLATTARNIDELLFRTVNLIVERFNFYLASIFLLDEAKETAILREATGIVGRNLKAEGFQLPMDAQSIIAWVARNNRPRVVSNVLEDPYYIGHEQLPDTESEVSIPISIGEEVLGVLDVQSRRRNAFDDDLVEVLHTLANQLAAVIQNYRLLEGTEINLQEMSALYRGSRQIAHTETEEAVFRSASFAIQQTSSIGAVYIPKEDHFVLIPGEESQPIYAPELPESLNISRQQADFYFKPATPVIIKDVNQPATPIHAELLVMPQKLGCLAAAYIPVIRENQLAALMILGSRERGTLTQTTLQPHASLADQVTTALDKVIALGSTEQRLNELQTLNKLSQLMVTETELTELFEIIHNQVKELIGDVTYYIALHDPDTDFIEIPYVYEDGIVSHLAPFPMGEGLTSIVIRTGKPLMIVENAEQRARELGVKLSGIPAKSWLGIPLVVAGEVFGVLTVQDKDKEHSFDDDDLRLFETLASQIAGAIHSARILEESKRRAIQLQTASEIARDTSGTLERDELLRKAINLVRDRYDFYHASVFLLDSSGEFAIVRESTGEAGRQMIAAGHKLQVGAKSVIGHVTGTGQPLVVNDVTKDPTHHFNPLLPETHAELGIPLKVGNQVLGALDVQSTTPYAFSQDDIEVLEILADQLAVAVANANLFAETQEHLAQHRLIHHVTTVAASSTSVEDALSSAVQGFRVALGDRVAILLVNVEKSYLLITASSGYEQDLAGMEIEFGKGVTGWVAENREALIVNDVLSDPRYIPGDQSVRSEIAVPLIYRGELLGVLNVESDQPNAFDEHDMDILGTLAGSLAAIIVNARLSERQRMLFEVTNKIRRSTNMENILQTTANELSKAMKARRARIELGIKDLVTETTPDTGPDNGKDGN